MSHSRSDSDCDCDCDCLDFGSSSNNNRGQGGGSNSAYLCCCCLECCLEDESIDLIVWWLLGGIFMAAGWLFLTAISFVSVIGYYTGLTEKCLSIALFCFNPIGSKVKMGDVNEVGNNLLQWNCCCNIIWAIFVGWFVALGHLFCGAVSSALCFCGFCGYTLYEHHWQLAMISIFPYQAQLE